MTYTVHLGDCLEVMRTLEPNSVDAIVTDPPYGLAFMGKAWDHAVPGPEFFAEMLRVAKPGAHLFAFGGTRLYHRMTCAIEEAGWEVRDCLSWLYGSGFPKSMAIDKALDRRRDDRADVYRVTAWVRAARDAAGLSNRDLDAAFGFAGMAGHWTSAASQPTVPTLEQVPRLLEVLGVEPPEEIRELLWTLNGRKGQPGEAWARREVVGSRIGVDTGTQRIACATAAQGLERSTRRAFDVTAPATDLARTFHGYGTALKPAWEPIVLAMKPTDGTFADNAEKWGVAGLHIDGGRVGTEPRPEMRSDGVVQSGNLSMAGGNTGRVHTGRVHTGRWPANLALDEEAAAMLDAESGVSRDGVAKNRNRTEERKSLVQFKRPTQPGPDVTYGGGGGASRFFYTGKASTEERTDGNTHPTVKPTDLMRWLVRLAKPPGGGVILDPFMGSGSTGVACIVEGARFIGIEREPEYLRIAEARIRRAHRTEPEVTVAADGTRAIQHNLFTQPQA